MDKKEIKEGIIRWSLLIGGGILGAGFTVLYMYYMHNELSIESEKDSFKFQILMFQGVVICIMTIYNVGYWGMKIFKIEDQAEEISKTKNKRNLIYNCLLLFMFIMSYIYD